MERLVQIAVDAVSVGSLYALTALGIGLIFGVMRLINFAHGELITLAAYALLGLSGMPVPVMIFGAIAVAVLLALITERAAFRPLRNADPTTLLISSFAVSFFLQKLLILVVGSRLKGLNFLPELARQTELFGIRLQLLQIVTILVGFVLLVGLTWFLRATRLGLHMRAVTQNRRMAGSMGIRTGRVDALTFGLGSGVAGMAGVALSQIDNVSPNLGQGYIIDSFMVVVFGGVGNLWGTLVGALTLGVMNKFLEPFAGAVLGKIVVLILLILFIQRRPRGMFPLKGRAVEA